ncbi:MAG: diguanylate cyclase [Burkholderiaceae bacterium]|nr:MAG: diguanylate cyclase [Burkholderiaceae bacterium]
MVGCDNRRYVLAALEAQRQRADKSGIPLCLAMLDFDHFKRIDDEAQRTFARIAQQGVGATRWRSGSPSPRGTRCCWSPAYSPSALVRVSFFRPTGGPRASQPG